MSDDSNDVSSLFEGLAEFEGDPPIPPEHDEHYYTPEVIIGWLNSVANDHDRYYCLSHAFSSVVLHSRRAGRNEKWPYLYPGQHERLLAAARRARDANPSMFWEGTATTRQITREGFSTLEKMFDLWSDEPFARMSYSNEDRQDIFAYARIFQNLMHNISLAEEIEERMKARAAKDVARIRSMALGSASTPELAT